MDQLTKMEEITAWLSANGPDIAIQIGIALAIFFVGKIIARILANVVQGAMRRAKTDELLVGFIGNITYAVLLIAVVLAAVDSLGVNVTSLLAILGAAGLAVGLALKDSLANFAAGVMIIIFRPFKVGDWIEAAGASGTVDQIGLFATMLHSGDNQRIMVPNDSIINGNIVNTNALPTRRIDLIFGISYDDDIARAKEIIRAVLDADERILDDPAPVVRVGELADSSVNLQVRPWVKTEDYWGTRTDLLEIVKIRFDEAGISIPFPQQDVHYHEVRAAS